MKNNDEAGMPTVLRGDWLTAAVDMIFRGQVVALAFERLFGLAADALNGDAVAASAQIKGRPAYTQGDKPVQVILPDVQAIETVCDRLPPLASTLAERYWPGPLTLLVPAKNGLPAPLIGPGGLIGVRVPGDSPALALARATGKVLTATSANRRGAEEPLHYSGLLGMAEVAGIVAGDVPGPPGSTIVDASGDAPRVLRQGVLSL